MAEKPVNVTPEDQKLQHANAQQNDLARILAFLEETVKSRVDLNGFERDRIFIAAGETAHLSPPPFARSVVMVGLSSWTLTTMGTLSFSVTNPTAFIPILTPGAPVDVKNPTSADAQVTVVYLGENPSQLMASLFATTSTLTTQLTGSLGTLPYKVINLLGELNVTETAGVTFTSTGDVAVAPGASITYGPYNLLGYKAARAAAQVANPGQVWQVAMSEYSPGNSNFSSVSGTTTSNGFVTAGPLAIDFPLIQIVITNNNTAGGNDLALAGVAVVAQ